MDAGAAVQKAVLAALASLQALGKDIPVYDAVPQGAAYPYVTLDSHIAANSSMLVHDRMDRLLYFTVWSQHRGQREVLEVMAAMRTALHRVRLDLDLGSTAHASVDRQSTQRDSDNTTFMGRLTLRVVTDH